MSLHHTHPVTLRDLCGNPAVEEIELRECGGAAGFADEGPRVDAGRFDGDELTEREIDEMFVAEMTRRDREAAATDPDRTPPAAAHPRRLKSVDEVADWSDEDLLTGIGLCDEGRPAWGDDGERAAWLDAATAEVVRRLDARRRAA